MSNQLATTPPGPPGDPPPTRHRSAKHPGVSFKPITCRRAACPPRSTCWAVRWRELGADCKRHVHAQPRTEVERYAIQQAIRLRDNRARDDARRFKAVTNGHDPDAVAAVRYPIVDACRTYMSKLSVKDSPSRRRTLKNFGPSLQLFIKWTRDAGVTHFGELTVDVLRAWYGYLLTRPLQKPKRNGRATYAINAVNTTVKPVRAMLRREIALSHVPHVTDSNLRECIPHVPTKTDDDRRELKINSATALSSKKIRRLLRAALRRDADLCARGWPRPPCASDIALLLLLGTRRDEYTGLRRRAVKRSKQKGLYVRVVGKRARKRHVYMRWSPIGSEILRAQIAGHGRDEWISHHKYSALAHVLVELHTRYGAPNCSSHDLRATCATAQLDVAGLDAVRAAYRLGHSLNENLTTYTDADGDMIVGAAQSIEHAMRARKMFRAVLAAMATHPTAARRDARPESSAGNTLALLAEPSALDEALARMRPLRATVDAATGAA